MKITTTRNIKTKIKNYPTGTSMIFDRHTTHFVILIDGNEVYVEKTKGF